MRAVAFLAFLLMGSAAWSADMGGYIGLSLGQGPFITECDETCRHHDAAVVRPFLGYNFNRNFAVEGGINVFSDSAAVDFSGVASLPLGERFALYGRLGVIAGDGGGTSIVGVGVRFDVSEQFALRGEVQHFGADNGVEVVSLGFLVRF